MLRRTGTGRGWPVAAAGRRVAPLALLAGTALSASSGIARAQLAEQYFPSDIPGYSSDLRSSVAERELLEGLQPGVEVDSFVVRPSLSESLGYQTNTLGIPGSGSSELETIAGIRLNSDWTRNAIGVSASVDDRRYFEEPVASYTNWTTGAGGSLTLGSDTATLSYAHLGLNLSAGSLGTYGVVDPVPYAVDDVRLGYSALRGRFSFQPLLEFQNFSFGSSGGNYVVSYDGLSHRTESGSLSTRYALSTGNALVAILKGSDAQFTTRGAGGNDYGDVTGFFGLDIRGDSLLQYRLLVGAERRSFDAAGSTAVTTPTAEAETIWTPRRTDTLTFDVSRHLDDPESPFSRNQTLTTVRLQWNRELTRSIFLSAYGSLGWSDSQAIGYGGTSISQRQQQAGISADWKINRFAKLSAYYSYLRSVSGDDAPFVTTSSGVSTTTFTANGVGLSLTFSE